MQIIETNLPTNGSFSRRNKTDEIILHHARTARCTEAARNGRSARTRRAVTAAQSVFAARAAI